MSNWKKEKRNYLKTSKQASDRSHLKAKLLNRNHQLQRRFSLKAGEESVCGNKTKYTMDEAIDMACIKKLQPYHCIFCENWHIGHEISDEEMKDYLQ